MLCFIIILFFGISLAGFLSYSFTKGIIIKNVKQNLKNETEITETNFSYLIQNKNFDVYAEKVKKLTGKRVTIIDEKGTVLGESDEPAANMENHSNREEVMDALKTGEGSALRYSNTEKTYYYYYAARYNYEGKYYIIRLSMKVVDINAIQENYLKVLVLSIIAGIAVSLLLANLYLTKLTGPIKLLTKAASRITLGQYDRRININSKDEIGKLSESFNIMADKLEKTINDLSDKTNKLESILHGMNDGVIVVDKNENITLINPSACNFFSIKENCEGRHFIEVIRNNDMEDIIRNVSSGDEEVVINYPEQKNLRVLASELLNSDTGTKIGKLLVIQDITRIKKLEKMRSDFVANVSHELKTPLTSIKGFAETLKMVEDDETRNKFLDIIYIESERLTRLINDILTLSEIENKEAALNFEKINITESMKDIEKIIEPAAKAKKIKLEFKIDNKDIFINGDLDKFKQMIINLVDNAVKYTNENGWVKVSLTKDDISAIIKVSDNGIGIDEKNISRIFERFYRVDKARSRSIGGTGLGLAIVKHTVILMKGTIEVKSKLGQGTTFTVNLPL